MTMKIMYYTLAILCLPLSRIESQNIRINEVVASNSIFLDEEGSTPDWIELYNPNPTDIILEGWAISDDISTPEKWTFPNYCLLYTSPSPRDKRQSRMPSSA